MAIFPLGSVIKRRREELGLTQEALADGICSIATLSRIENGDRLPTKSHFEILMQRLGYCAQSLDFYTDKQDFEIHELKFQIRQAFTDGQFDAARISLEAFDACADQDSPVEKQFSLLYHVLLYKEKLSASQQLAQLECAMRMTHPSYDPARVPKLLSYEEIILLNNIALRYFKAGEINKSISIFSGLRSYYGSHIISQEEALRTQPMVLYNYSKALGMQGDYDTCIDVCDQGIRLAYKTSRCSYLYLTLFNCGWAMLQRNAPGDAENARIFLKKACCAAYVMDSPSDFNSMSAFYKQAFGDSLSL